MVLVESQQGFFWYAVVVRSRHEKVLHAHLEQRGVTSFLPSYRSLRRWRDRRVELELPLFPGYLFVHIDQMQALPVLSAPGAVRLVGAGSKPTPLDTAQIEAIRAGLPTTRIEPHCYLGVGDRVVIVKGPLAGMRGVLKSLKNSVSVVVTIEAIFQSVCVEVRRDDVELVHASSSSTLGQDSSAISKLGRNASDGSQIYMRLDSDASVSRIGNRR